MTDITKCEGENCPLKDRCYRFTAPTEEHYQSYFLETPYENDQCAYFWDEDK